MRTLCRNSLYLSSLTLLFFACNASTSVDGNLVGGGGEDSGQNSPTSASGDGGNTDCSANTGGSGGTTSGGPGPSSGTGASSGTAGSAGNSGFVADFPDGSFTYNPGVPREPNACASVSGVATTVTRPIDIIVSIDNSSSMNGEIKAVQTRVNDDLARIIEDFAHHDH